MSKEEQARRKLVNLQNEVESSRALRYDAERALRAELGALKDQVAKVSKRLLTEETDTKKLKTEIEQVRLSKSKFVEDLDACKLLCDNRMQGKMTELRTKTEKLNALKQEVLDCRCKKPQDNSTEAKRTPSLAAICRCTSEDKLHGSCSCKSLRSTLLTNLLRDLFEGLQSELNDSGSIMPCELLKCLEDSHNWDRTSTVKTNLRNFFAKLLVGELDIAIVSSIEKYHARWIGDSCADRKIRSDSEVDERQQRALENRAQQLAEQLAEQLFQERAEELMKTAKNIMKESQPPCDCGTRPAATYSCIINTNMDKPLRDTKIKNKMNSSLKENTGKNIRNQSAFQKTKIFKKGTTKPIKERINKMATPVFNRRGMVAKQIFNHRAVCTDKYESNSNFLINRLKKKYVDHGTRIDMFKNDNLGQNVSNNCYLKCFKRLDHSYAVNLCLYEPHKDQNLEKALSYKKIETNCALDEEETRQRFNSSSFLVDIPSIELANSVLQPFVMRNESSREGNTLTCSNNCLCFNKLPSNQSLDNILESYREKNIAYSTALNEKRNDIIFTDQDRIRTSYHFDTFNNYCENKNKQESTLHIPENNNHTSMYHSNFVGFDTKRMNSQVTRASNKNKLSSKDVKVSTSYEDIKKNSKHKQSNMFPQEQNLRKSIRNQCNKYTNIEKNLCDSKTSALSFNLQQNESLNGAKKCVVDTSKDPFNFDCRVEFLGVTLHNGENKDKENQNKFTNKPSKEENTEDVFQINCDDKKGNKHFNTVESKFNKRNNDGNFDENMSFLNTKNKCVCCNNDEETCELEANTFSLLTEYLQKKLEEYKLSTCRSSDILPIEADLLFNQIIEKVKKMILESSKELTYCCFNSNESDSVDACWRRACGLLQEYLRMKMKRLERSYSIENDNLGSNSLAKILDKICKMIENDFEQLKTMSKDSNSLKCNKIHSREKQLSDTKFYSSIFKINEDSKDCTEKNNFKDSPPTMLINGQLNMKHSEENEEETIVSNVEGVGQPYLFHSNNSESDTKITNSAENALNRYSTGEKLDNEKIFLSMLTKEKENHNSRYAKTQSMSVPCVNYNVDCACNKILDQCICTKTILKRNINLIDANTTPSYIIQNTLKTDLSKSIAVGYSSEEENKRCEKEIETLANNEMVELKESDWDFQKGANNSANTHHQLYDNMDYFSYDEWDDCESVPFHENGNDFTSNKMKFTNSLLLPLYKPGNSRDKTLLSNSDNMLICSTRSHDCECDMVPICHVKMLMDNIERKLLNNKCTCDSLHPSVCPAHSETVS